MQRKLLNLRIITLVESNLTSKSNHIKFIKSKCHNPTLRECEDETHTPKIGTWESFGIPEISKFHCKGQNTLHWGVLYIIGKLAKCRCQKGLTWLIWTFVTRVIAKRKAKSQTSILTPNH
jgi:hypothetical protein